MSVKQLQTVGQTNGRQTSRFKTVATEMLGIEYPIVCGGMTATGSGELAAAVSNAGGLGMLTCLHCRTPDGLDAEIKKTRGLTRKPFGVNLTILGEKRGAPEFPKEFAQVIIDNKIRIVETCGGGIELMSKLHEILRQGGVEVIMSKCVQVKHALVAQDKLGSDMISLMGFDSGGLPGEADTGLFIQAPLAKKLLKIPFLLSGGVATGQQLLAALAMGAAGVQIGTRFNATRECNIFPESFKEKMIKGGPKDTVIVMRPFRASSRVFKNQDAMEIIKIQERMGQELQFSDIGKLAKFDRLMEGIEQADPEKGIWNAGQSIALIDDVPTCEQLVVRIIDEASESLKNLNKLFQSSL